MVDLSRASVFSFCFRPFLWAHLTTVAFIWGDGTRHGPPVVVSEEPWSREHGLGKTWLSQICSFPKLLKSPPPISRVLLHWVVLRTSITYKTAGKHSVTLATDLVLSEFCDG